MKQKLRSSRGFTLTEVLVTVMIVSLLSLGVAAGSASAFHAYRSSVAFSESAVLTSTLTQAVADELRLARDIAVAGDGSVTYTSASYGLYASISHQDGRLTVAGAPLVGDGAYTNLAAEAEVSYSAGLFDVVITIFRDGDEINSVTFSVSPLNTP